MYNQRQFYGQLWLPQLYPCMIIDRLNINHYNTQADKKFSTIDARHNIQQMRIEVWVFWIFGICNLIEEKMSYPSPMYGNRLRFRHRVAISDCVPWYPGYTL